MILKTTVLNVADNSGVRVVRCMHVYGGTKQTSCGVGDIIMVSARDVLPNGKYKKGQKFKAVVVRSKNMIYRRFDGSKITFSDNAVVLLSDKYEMLGTRVMGPVCRELRSSPSFSKIISLAPEVI